jgi:hypothetical protein
MSGYFMLRTESLRAAAPNLSGVGFKILLDILATSEQTMRVKEFPLNFAARAEGESKLDRTVVFEFLVGLYDKWLGRIIPTRFALFGTIGAMGVVVHMAVLAAFLSPFGGELAGNVVTNFEMGQTLAAVVAMTFNFFLNNALTYADKRLTGFAGAGKGLDQVRADLLGRPARQCRRGCRAGALRLPRISRRAGRHRDRFGVELRAQLEIRLGSLRQLIFQQFIAPP